MKDLNVLEGEKVYFEDLHNEKWILVPKSEKEFIEIIENSYYKLKDIANIRVGLATLADKVYILDDPVEDGNYFVKYFNGKKFFIEKNNKRDNKS